MKYATAWHNRQLAVFLVEDELAIQVAKIDDPSKTMTTLLQAYQEHSEQQLKHNTDSVPVSELKFAPAVPHPQKIICVGRNYREHAEEMGSATGESPTIFSKFNSSLVGHQAQIELPAISSQVDYEAELVVVIGKSGRNIKEHEAKQHVFGYTCGNDVSARDWQKGQPGGQWLLGKSFETFAPLGPWIVTADEIDNVEDLNIELRLNDQTMQSSNTSQLIFKVDFLIAHLSRFFTLQPGDLIFTGTPSGVGFARDPQVFLKPGDIVEVEIQGIGALSNQVTGSC